MFCPSRLTNYYYKLFLFCCAAILWSTSLNAKPVILILGDSLSAAYQMPIEKGWVWLLKQKLSHLEVQVVNQSISGSTTSNGLNRLPGLLAQYQPHIVILELGGNDGLRGLPLKNIYVNLKQMIDLSLQTGAKVLLLGMRLPPNYGETYTTQFAAIYHTLSTEYHLPLVPFLLDKVALDPKLMLSDGIHPSPSAQGIILENVWPYLKPLL